jgi:hypothetical protein
MNPWTVSLSGALALAVAMGIGRFAFTPVLPLMQDEGLGVAQGGWLAAANYLGYLAGALCAASLPLSSAAVLRWSLVAIAAVTAAMAWDGGFGAWLVLRFVAGVLSAWVLIHASAWALGRNASGAVVFSGVGAGIAFVGLTCLALMSFAAWAPHAWLTLGAAALVLSALAFPALHDGSGRVGSVEGPLRLNANAWTLVACYGAYGFGYILPATFLPAMAKQVVPDPAVFGWAWPLFGIAGMLSTLLAARLRMDDRRLWAWSHFVMAAGVVLPVLAPGIAAIAFSALAVGGTFMVITMAGIATARASGGSTRLVAAMTGAFAAGQLAGPLVVAALGIDERGFAGPLLFAGALLLASGFALLRQPIGGRP